MDELADHRAIVTGGAQGIGLKCVEALAAAGAEVLIADLDADRARVAAERVAVEQQAIVTAASVDVGDPEQCESLIAGVSDPPADLLVNCAAFYREAAALEMDPGIWTEVVTVCLNGAFFSSQAFARAAVAAGRTGRIVNISSVTATHSMAGKAAYGAAKAGLDSLTRSLALEWGPMGINVNGVAPSHTATETIKELAAAGLLATDRIAARIPLGRLAEPAEIADAVVFLCSDRARFVNGHVLAVDGGYTANGDW